MPFLCLLALGSCAENPNQEGGMTVEDFLGREVYIPDGAEKKVVCIGAGSLRLYAYMNGVENLVGVENIEKTDGVFKGIPRPYKDVYADELADLPIVGQGGPKGQTPEPEAILSADPTLVISMLTDASAANELQETLGVPVVCLAYGSRQVFDAKLKTSITLLGKILNKESRASELTSYIDGVATELGEKTAGVKDEEKPSVYLGCIGNYGTQDIYSTCASYSLFDVSNIKNVVDGATDVSSGYVTMDKEKLLALDPDKIILDGAGVGKFKTTYYKDKESFDSLSAFKNGEVYLQMPYNAYYTNIEVAVADAYYNAKIAYPSLFADLDMEAKTNEITAKFLGVECYDEIASMSYGGFQKISSDFWDKVTAV